GRPPAHYVEREGDRGHAPEPRGTGAPGPVPGGSLPSPERDPAAPAATARAGRGHPAACPSFPPEERERAGRRSQAPDGSRPRGHEVVLLAGKRAPARERMQLAHRDGAKPDGRCEGP